MPVETYISQDAIIEHLRLLCAQPSSTRNTYELADTASLVADMIRRAGLDARVIRTDGAPVVIGKRTGHHRSTLLLYHHYDVNPAGPWRDWSHGPFALGEREEKLFARGVAHGKGPLVAHLQALQTLIRLEKELPYDVVMVVEGERLCGSPNLARVIKKYLGDTSTNIIGCLSSGGERDVQGKPFCYSGSKGILQVRLKATGAKDPLDSGLATSVRNPLWRLIWALNSIKGEDEDIRFNGFYDDVDGPERSQRDIIRKVKLDEEGRLQSWHIPQFLFGMKGPALVRTEVTLPTCHISSLISEPAHDMNSIPTGASAHLEFQLVPKQRPEVILKLLLKHLEGRGFHDITPEVLPGRYPPVITATDQPFIQQLVATGTRIYNAPLTVLPCGPFSQPLHIFTGLLKIPAAVLGFARHNSCIYGTNENLPLEDIVSHAQFLIDLLMNDETHTTANG